MRIDDAELDSTITLVYEMTEEARLLLEADRELIDATRAAGEAAYHISDTIEPDERIGVLAVAKSSLRRPDGDEDGDDPAARALALMRDASRKVQEILRGPSASSELRIGLRALQRGIGDLAGRLTLDTDHPVSRPQSERLRFS